MTASRREGSSGSGSGIGDDCWDAVLFDLDGTLADTIPLILHCFRHTMLKHRPSEVPDETRLLASIGRPLRETMADFAPDPDEAEQLRATYVAFQHTVHDDMVTAFPGAVEEVARLVDAGMPIAIVTSKGREMTGRTMDVCGLDRHFSTVITATDVVNAKPHPEPVLMALDALGVPVGRRVLFVGDSPHDIHAGQAAGVTTMAVPWGATSEAGLIAARPDHLIRSWSELRMARAVGGGRGMTAEPDR